MNLAASLLEHSSVYRAWQAPFVDQKFAPVLAHNRMNRIRRVLDVACGPGTNTAPFADMGYPGIDFNERYIQDARRHHRRDFLVADVGSYVAPPETRFDFILVNSFLHHLKTKEVLPILEHLRYLLTKTDPSTCWNSCFLMNLPPRGYSLNGIAANLPAPWRSGEASSRDFSSRLSARVIH